MVSFTQITAVAVVALAANVQATQIVPNVLKTVTQVLGKRDSVVMRGESSLYERGIYSPPHSPPLFFPLTSCLLHPAATSSSTLESGFTACVAQLHTKRPVVAINQDKSVTLSGVPKVCMDEAKAWNSQPNIKALNQVQGVITIKGTDTLTLTGLKDAQLKEFEGLA
jgi:hypothetical protein